MEIKEIEKQLKTKEKVEYKGKCHECGKDVTVCCFKDKETKAITIEGGAVYDPLVGTPLAKQIFLKCDDCFMDDPVLRNYQLCDVYSRVVGYIRPVSGWNRGKIEEFKQRKEFVVEEPNPLEDAKDAMKTLEGEK